MVNTKRVSYDSTDSEQQMIGWTHKNAGDQRCVLHDCQTVGNSYTNI